MFLIDIDKNSMDIVGSLPTTPRRNSHVLTIQDFLTDAFINSFVCRFGSPRAI